MKLPPRVEKGVDLIGMIVALIVDLTMNLVCFYLLAPDALTAVAFSLIGVMIVLFVFRSWSKGQFFAWLIFVSVVFFFDYSLALEATRAQTTTVQQHQININDVYREDVELQRLVAKQLEISTALKDLQQQYRAAAKRETLDELDSQIRKKEADASYYEQQYQARRGQVELEAKKQSKSVDITSEAIFSAVPNAYRDKRYTQLIVYGLIFFGLQLIVVTSIDPVKKTKKLSLLRAWLLRRAPALDGSSDADDSPQAENTTAAKKHRIAATRAFAPRLSAARDSSKKKEKTVVQQALQPVETAATVPEATEATEATEAKPRKTDIDSMIRDSILTPIRDNELHRPDALAYELGIDIDVINRFFAALAAAKGPAGRPLIYERDGKWFLGYSKDIVLASLARTSQMFANK